MFDKLFGTKIKVEFINDLTGETFATSSMAPDQLPESFEIATTMHIGNEDWTVVEAIPTHSNKFKKSKSLKLKLRKVEYMNVNDILFSLPSISNEFPIIGDRSLYNDFELTIISDEYRQKEFLNQSSSTLVDIEISKIETIWKDHSKDMNGYYAFTKTHVRDRIGYPNLSISLKELMNMLGCDKIGQLTIAGEGFVKNGFALKTNFTTYYGTTEQGIIKEFCIEKFQEESIHEIGKITEAYNLIFVNWYHRQVIA